MSDNDNDNSNPTEIPEPADPNPENPSAAEIEILLDRLPAEQRIEIVSRFYTAPLPPPVWFGEYNQIVPGAADRILVMAEKEQNHRHEIECAQQLHFIEASLNEQQHLHETNNTLLVTSNRYQLRGLNFGLASAFGLIVGGAYCATIEQPGVAIAFEVPGHWVSSETSFEALLKIWFEDVRSSPNLLRTIRTSQRIKYSH